MEILYLAKLKKKGLPKWARISFITLFSLSKWILGGTLKICKTEETVQSCKKIVNEKIEKYLLMYTGIGINTKNLKMKDTFNIDISKKMTNDFLSSISPLAPKSL